MSYLIVFWDRMVFLLLLTTTKFSKYRYACDSDAKWRKRKRRRRRNRMWTKKYTHTHANVHRRNECEKEITIGNENEMSKTIRSGVVYQNITYQYNYKYTHIRSEMPIVGQQHIDNSGGIQRKPNRWSSSMFSSYIYTCTAQHTAFALRVLHCMDSVCMRSEWRVRVVVVWTMKPKHTTAAQLPVKNLSYFCWDSHFWFISVGIVAWCKSYASYCSIELSKEKRIVYY